MVSDPSPQSTPSPPSSPNLSPCTTPTASPLSTPSSPWTPPSPATITYSREHSAKNFSPPDMGISEMNFNPIDYLREPIVDENLEVLNIAPTSVLRQIILNPMNVAEEWKNLKMLTNQGKLVPAHLPSTTDLVSFPTVARIFFFWKMAKLEKQNSHNIIPEEVIPFIDPPPRLPRVRTLLLMHFLTVDLESKACSNTVFLVRNQTSVRQIQLHATWKLGKVREYESQVDISLDPRLHLLYDPRTGGDRAYKVGKLLEGEPINHFPYHKIRPDMTFLYWNARGIARLSFLSNIKLLIYQQQPHTVIIYELRVSRANVTEIVGKLPFDDWVMADPVGFSGGILILWKTQFLKFETTRMSNQGIRCIVQGATSPSSWDED